MMAKAVDDPCSEREKSTASFALSNSCSAPR
jgi:hypothetical protein